VSKSAQRIHGHPRNLLVNEEAHVLEVRDLNRSDLLLS
jgi:hypothetical protein